MKYLLTIAYDGRRYCGYQVQKNGVSIQEMLGKAAETVFGRPCSITGCSRTDSGVHANEFCITVENEGGTVPADKLDIAIARFLPEDISLFYAKECDQSFHPRYDVVGKEYLYKILNARVSDPFLVNRAWFLPRRITDEGLEKMRRAAAHLLGKHDFSAFMAAGSDTEDTVRNVKYVDIQRNGDNVEIRIFADGFLYNMVRIIVGTLTEVAFGRFGEDDVLEILKSGKRENAGMTAPAEGLYLNRVEYEFPKLP